MSEIGHYMEGVARQKARADAAEARLSDANEQVARLTARLEEAFSEDALRAFMVPTEGYSEDWQTAVYECGQWMREQLREALAASPGVPGQERSRETHADDPVLDALARGDESMAARLTTEREQMLRAGAHVLRATVAESKSRHEHYEHEDDWERCTLASCTAGRTAARALEARPVDANEPGEPEAQEPGCLGDRHVWDVPNGIDPGLGARCLCGRVEWDGFGRLGRPAALPAEEPQP